MDAIKEILVLGGYGAYVWPAFGTWAVVMVWMAVSTMRRLRGSEATLERMQSARSSRWGADETDAGQKEARS